MADNKTWQSLKPFVNGGLSGIGATCVIQPLDIVKARGFCAFRRETEGSPASPPFDRLPPPRRAAAPSPRRCAQLPCATRLEPTAARAAAQQAAFRRPRSPWTPN
jgi:hypothetical protein